jgi:hypothetical protein
MFEELDGLLKVVDTSSLGTIMSGRDKILDRSFDRSFVFLKERMDVVLV